MSCDTISVDFPSLAARDDGQVEQAKQWRYKCCPKPDVHFQIAIASDWSPVQVSQLPPTRRSVSDLAHFQSQSCPGAHIGITAIKLVREMGSADWLDLYLKASGQTIVRQRTQVNLGDRSTEALTHETGSRDTSIIGRYKTVKDGCHLFLIHAKCSMAHYDHLASEWDEAFASFRLLNPCGLPFAENLQRISRNGPTDYCFYFPQSWQAIELNTPEQGIGAIQLTNVVDDLAVGRVQVIAFARDKHASRHSLLERFRVGFGRRDGKAWMPQWTTSQISERFKSIWQCESLLANENSAIENQQRRFFLAETANSWFVVIGNWEDNACRSGLRAINRRAFEIVTDTLTA